MDDTGSTQPALRADYKQGQHLFKIEVTVDKMVFSIDEKQLVN